LVKKLDAVWFGRWLKSIEGCPSEARHAGAVLPKAETTTQKSKRCEVVVLETRKCEVDLSLEEEETLATR
jgi:hypothetical protein